MLLSEKELRCGDRANRVPAESPQVPADQAPGASPVVWISTDLDVWTPSEPRFIARDCQVDERCYRRLDPQYFGWLKIKMHEVKAAADAGRVPAAAFDELRLRFNGVQFQAIVLFGEEALLDAVRTLDAERYRPPLPEEVERPKPIEPTRWAPAPQRERLARARRLVDAIRDEALALGWSMDSLYFSDGYDRNPINPRYGLVCYVRADHRIGEVARQSIELIGPPPHETRSRFYNPDVDQPWEIRAGRQTEQRSANTPARGFFVK